MIKILDCTLRDGGYYNNWKFDLNLVKNYLRAMEACSINYVELGFRFISSDLQRGPYGETSENFLKTLELPSSLRYAVMINGSEYLKPTKEEVALDINNKFISSADSKISLVRVAINFDNALNTKHIIGELKNLGYEVGLNLMQSSAKSEKEYIDLAKEIEQWGLVDILYFADSFGNMDPEEVNYIVGCLRKGWSGALGFHSHNNKGYALINSVNAIKAGVEFCDSTVTGMGRGAGNVTTESLLMELVNEGLLEVDLSLVQGTVSDFTKLKEKYGWGPNMHYQYAANNNIHPTFVQTLSEDNRYDQYQSFKILESLAMEENSSRFSNNSIKDVIYKKTENNDGSWDPKGFLKDKEILLVGGGISVLENREDILNFVDERDLAVIFMNINNYLPQDIGLATIASHEIRGFLDASSYSELSHPLIIPMKGLGGVVKSYIKNMEIYDYGLNLKEGAMEIGKKYCELDNSIVAGYALAVCTRAGAKKINLVGFDGYQKGDIRYQEMSELLRRYTQLDEAVELVSLTPSLYSLRVSSLDV